MFPFVCRKIIYVLTFVVRIEDFVVHEVDLDGNVVTLTSLTADKIEEKV